MFDPILSKYYSDFLPLETLTKLIPLDPPRELSFTFENSFLRNQNLNLTDLKDFLVTKTPKKMDLGAISNLNQPIKRKELIFDVDLSDYPRICCEGKKICEKCFKIIPVVAKKLNFILKNSFGFNKILFFFSGGRGLHCFVIDEDAMLLTDLERSAIISMIENNEKGKNNGKNENINDLTDSNIDFPIILDKNVTKDTKHLIKMPFCIHPNSKLVCVSLDLKTIDSLNLKDIPSVFDVIEDPKKLEPFLCNLKNQLNL